MKREKFLILSSVYTFKTK